MEVRDYDINKIRVVCISDSMYVPSDSTKRAVTVGKVYDVITTTFTTIAITDRYFIKDDDCNHAWYHARYFKNLSELRDEKINKILDDENI